MNKKIGMLFPGQGSQYEGMSRELISSSTSASDIFRIAREILDDKTYKIIEDSKIEDLSKTRYAQLAIFLNSVALFSELKNRGIEANSMVGLSLGEYSALCCAGIIDLKDAIELVKNRGQIMEKGVFKKGSMIAVMKSNVEDISKIIEETKGEQVLSICNLNSPDQIVVGGEFEALDRFEEACKSNGIKRTIRLNVEGPFHTEILVDSAKEFRIHLDSINYTLSKNKVYSNVDANIYNDVKLIPKYLEEQMCSPVLFEKCVRNMIEDGCSEFIEVGPGKALAGFIKKIDKSIKVYSVQKLEDIDILESELKR